MENIQTILWIITAIAIIFLAASIDDTKSAREIQIENSFDSLNWNPINK